MTVESFKEAARRPGRLRFVRSVPAETPRVAAGSGEKAIPASLPQEPLHFVWGYVRRRPGSFGLLAAMVVAAASAAVAIQYMMKLLVDGMAAGPGRADSVWMALAAFVLLIVVENALWRGSGWLGCRTTIAVGRDI